MLNCTEVEALLVDYFDHKLDEKKRGEVDAHLEHCAQCRNAAQETESLFRTMANSSIQIPPESLRENFQVMLQSELNMRTTENLLDQKLPGSQKETRKVYVLNSPWTKIAAALILVTGGIWIGSSLNHKPVPSTTDEFSALKNEVKEMKEVLMYSMIDDESASQRIKAVGYVDEMANPDAKVINTLVNTLNTDKNVNVRLAALYSLAKFTDNHVVRDSLVDALGKQTEPVVQVVLINLLTDKKEHKAIAPIRSILTDKNTLREVKDVAQKSLKLL